MWEYFGHAHRKWHSSSTTRQVMPLKRMRSEGYSVRECGIRPQTITFCACACINGSRKREGLRSEASISHFGNNGKRKLRLRPQPLVSVKYGLATVVASAGLSWIFKVHSRTYTICWVPRSLTYSQYDHIISGVHYCY